MSSLLTLDAIDRAIGDFLVGLPIQRPPDRKTARCVISNNLNAADRLAPRPLPNGLQALFEEPRSSFRLFPASSCCQYIGHLPPLVRPQQFSRHVWSFLVVGLSIGERVHSFVNPPWGFVGWDSSRKAVVRLIREAKPLEIGGERAKRMKHALVVHAREGGCKFFATDMERVEAMERRLAE